MSDLLFKKPVSIIGKSLRFRQAEPQDAAFVLSLRLDETKNQHISATDPDVERQSNWIRTSQTDPRQSYFVIEDIDRNSIGTVRLYDPIGTSFCWGSWILGDRKPPSAAIESTLMVYAYGLFCGFDQSHFDVRQENTKVWQYHERMGAVRVREDAPDYFYVMEKDAIIDVLSHYRSRVDNSILVQLGSDNHASKLDLDKMEWQIIPDSTEA